MVGFCVSYDETHVLQNHGKAVYDNLLIQQNYTVELT